jgi:hypothetical protein
LTARYVSGIETQQHAGTAPPVVADPPELPYGGRESPIVLFLERFGGCLLAAIKVSPRSSDAQKAHIYTIEHGGSMNETCVGSLNTETHHA